LQLAEHASAIWRGFDGDNSELPMGSHSFGDPHARAFRSKRAALLAAMPPRREASLSSLQGFKNCRRSAPDLRAAAPDPRVRILLLRAAARSTSLPSLSTHRCGSRVVLLSRARTFVARWMGPSLHRRAAGSRSPLAAPARLGNWKRKPPGPGCDRGLSGWEGVLGWFSQVLSWMGCMAVHSTPGL
jgi:hypothetical protein